MSPPASPTASTQPKMMSSTFFVSSPLRSRSASSTLAPEPHGRHLVQAAVLLAASAWRAHGVIDEYVGHFQNSLGSPATAGTARRGSELGRRLALHASTGRIGRTDIARPQLLNQNASAASAIVESGARLDARPPQGRLRHQPFHEEARGRQLVLAGTPRRPRRRQVSGIRRQRHPAPHVAERHEPEEMHVVGRARAGVFGSRHGVVHEPHRRGLEVVEAHFSAA